MNINFDEFKQIISKNLTTIRELSGMTGDEFAKEISVSRAHLFNLENSLAHNISLESLYYLFDKYVPDLDYLFKKDMKTQIMTRSSDLINLKKGDENV